MSVIKLSVFIKSATSSTELSEAQSHIKLCFH